LGRLFSSDNFCERNPSIPVLGYLFLGQRYVLSFKKCVAKQFWAIFFHKLIRSPCSAAKLLSYTIWGEAPNLRKIFWDEFSRKSFFSRLSISDEWTTRFWQTRIFEKQARCQFLMSGSFTERLNSIKIPCVVNFNFTIVYHVLLISNLR
jgi:hypothetical protein